MSAKRASGFRPAEVHVENVVAGMAAVLNPEPEKATFKAINIRLPAALHRAVAQKALDEDTKINRLVIQALQELLAKPKV